VGALVLEQGGEAALGEEVAVLGEHREQDAHEEAAGRLADTEDMSIMSGGPVRLSAMLLSRFM
jgi:hypothetical protein